jgi:hypothetical protein
MRPFVSVTAKRSTVRDHKAVNQQIIVPQNDEEGRMGDL